MSAQGAPEAVTVELPCGFVHEEEVFTKAQIIPMTGRIRKLIARPQNRQNPAKIIDTLLTQCVVAIGDITRVNKSVTDRLFLGDRDFLVMEIRKVSLGKDVQTQLQCDSCGARLGMTLNLERDVPVTKMKDLDIDLVDGEAVFTLVDEVLKLDLKFRLPRGSDQHSVAPLYRKNPIEANYALYRACLLEWNGQAAKELSMDFFDNQPLPVIDFIDENFMEMMPGPDMRIPVDCYECNHEMMMSMASSDFLFKLPKTAKT
jgi:hypothetical protein